MGTMCFKKLFSNFSTSTLCDCKPDCSKIYYDFYSVVRAISSKDCANLELSFRDYLNLYQVKHLKRCSFNEIDDLKKILQCQRHIWNHDFYDKVFREDNKRSSQSNLCVERISRDIAIVDIIFTSEYASGQRQDVKANLADKISNIGNNL